MISGTVFDPSCPISIRSYVPELFIVFVCSSLPEVPHKRCRPFMIMNIPKNTIIVQMMLCNNANLFSFIYDDPTHSANNTGAVPSANSAMANPHSTNLQVLMAINCMESVNPHGRKKVSIPINGANAGFFVVSVFSDRFLGRCAPNELIFGSMPKRCNHIRSTTMPTMMVSMVVIVSDNVIASPNNHKSHPSRKNHPILPAWKASCVLT